MDGDNGYTKMAEAMVELSSRQPGFLGIESVRGNDGLGITVSYWASEEAIGNWKMNSGTHDWPRLLNLSATIGDSSVRERAFTGPTSMRTSASIVSY